MKIIAIGDIHGKRKWKKIVEKKNPEDIVVFIGDYLDSWHESPEEQVQNLKEILEYKKQHMHDCILLIGNHDFHYMHNSGAYERYSGWNPTTNSLLEDTLEQALADGLLQIAYQAYGYLFSHAGVTKSWLKRAGLENTTNISIVDDINNLFKQGVEHFRFAVGTDPTGDDPRSSPIWVRPESLEESQVEGLHQVVGHTRFSSIEISQKAPHLIFIDVLDHSDEYLEIENGGVKIMKI